MATAPYTAVMAVCFSVLATAAAFGGNPLAHPALNPVTPLPTPSHPPVTLVSGGVPQFVLMWDSADARARDASGREFRSVREAVRTLRREIGFCTGKEVEVVDTGETPVSQLRAQRPATPNEVQAQRPATSGAIIFVGSGRAVAPRPPPPIDLARLPPEGFVVTTCSNGVRIAGAVLWGAYDFIERFLGCRYYYPGPDGSVRPSCTNLVLAPCAYTDAPRFRNRCGGFSPELATVSRTLGTPLVRASISDWRAASRIARTVPFSANHSPEPRAWAASHPEWMGLSFLRRPDGGFYYCPTNHMKNYFDVTNLDFADALVEGLARDDTPEGHRRQGFTICDARTVVFGQCDSFRTLEEMRANPVVKREGLITDANVALGPCGYFSDIYGRFYQRLAERLNERLPGRRLILMPYAGCTYAPTQERFRRLPDNVELCVCLPKVPRFIRNPQVRDLMVRELHRWTEVIGGRPVQQIWTYNAFNSPFEQAVANEFLPETIAAFGKDLGETGIIVDLGLYPVTLPGQYIPFHFYYETYCAFRALWGGARFNPEAALDEHWTLFYGSEAGTHLRELHHILKDAFLAVSVPATRVRSLYPVETLDRIEAELAAARRILEQDKAAPAWRRFRLMAHPLEWELDRQRRRHVVPEPRKEVYFVAGEEPPP